MKQHLFKTSHPRGRATRVFAAAGFVLLVTASLAMAQDGQHMMGEHSQGMMGNKTGQGMMGNATGQGMTKDGDHRQEMMGADGHMMDTDNHHMTRNDHGTHGRDRQ